MKAISIIPARMAASRFPGKPLKKMLGMPLVEHCYHRTKLAEGLIDVYVATCDQEIYDYVESIGGKSIMTSDKHDRASTRTAEALNIIEKQTNVQYDIVVMMQGDEPLVNPETISESIRHFKDESIHIVNIMSKIESEDVFKDVNNVKVVTDIKKNAMYFSREPIPSGWKGLEGIPKYMQTGIISFRRDALLKFNTLNETVLERVESVDLNRVIENGDSIRMVALDGFTIGVDTEEELKQAEQYLMNDPITNYYINKE